MPWKQKSTSVRNKYDLNKQKETWIYGLEDLTMLRCQHYSVWLIYICKAVPIKIPMDFLQKWKNIIPQIHKELQEIPSSQSSVENKEKIWKIQLNFKTYYKVTINKTVWYWQKDRDWQWNGTQSPEINLYTYGQLILERVPKWFNGKERNSLFNWWY